MLHFVLGAQGSGNLWPEAPGVIVGLLHRQPAHRGFGAAVSPIGEEHGLACAWRPGHDRESTLESLREPPTQAISADPVAWEGRRHELGRGGGLTPATLRPHPVPVSEI